MPIATLMRLVAIASALVVLTGATSAAAVVGGAAAKRGSDDAVGLVSEGHVVCGGTLIAPDVVLTAAHCVASPISRVLVGNDEATGRAALVRRIERQPRFDARTLEHDVAVVVLADSLDITPAPVLRDGLVAGEDITLVAFGRDDARPLPILPPAMKREGTMQITHMREGSFVAAAHPATCRGDSGSGAYVTRAGVRMLAGVVSRGNCIDRATFSAVDTDFVAAVTKRAESDVPPAPSAPCAVLAILAAIALLVVVAACHGPPSRAEVALSAPAVERGFTTFAPGHVDRTSVTGALRGPRGVAEIRTEAMEATVTETLRESEQETRLVVSHDRITLGDRDIARRVGTRWMTLETWVAQRDAVATFAAVDVDLAVEGSAIVDGKYVQCTTECLDASRCAKDVPPACAEHLAACAGCLRQP